MILPALKKTYNGKLVLETSTITVPDGSIVAVCGHNGSGKSTMARILAGIIKDDSGKTIDLEQKVGYMCQASRPFRMSVRRNLLLNADKSLSKKENHARADALIAALGMDEFSSKNAARLSGGQTERMALARVLMKRYDLLILDEPTASMDQHVIPAAEELILDYRNKNHCTIFLITHSAEQAKRLADLVINLEEGHITSISGQTDEHTAGLAAGHTEDVAAIKSK